MARRFARPPHFDSRPVEQFLSGEWAARRQQHRLTKRQRRSAGLRRRLTRTFALLALFAVALTSFLTVNAAFRALNTVAPELGLSSLNWKNSPYSPQSPDAPVRTAQQRADTQRWQELGRAAGKALWRSSLTAAFFSFLLAVVLAAIVTSQITRPLSRLADAARRLEAGERNLQLPIPPRQDEVRDLTLTFNSLTTSLGRQEAWRRGLMADIAHDLRTPLSVLRSEIEAMQDGVNPTDDAGLLRLHGEVLLLARLVTDLRTLSLAESGAMDFHVQVLDAAEVLRGLLPGYQRQAAEVGVTLTLSAPVPVALSADPDRLMQVLHNLLSNALRYAAPGPVELSAYSEGQWACLRVRDHGPGFRPDDLSRAFERFYRADASRTRDPGGLRSSGLGLAIARALTEAQGGQIEAKNHPAGGAEFTVRLPGGEVEPG
ncbi:HAMP domain-containing protein [Deinococcus detaillensis]|uniref:histidine kinase n=1 Tax=Deinococcus detaillensis TaxID=2592048 RepID=A0A553V140_9DEIO|nr:HAMP domain-containing protein [Deinococcus detaillensis]